MSNEAHVRIDEGIKRGKRRKPGAQPDAPRKPNGTFLPILPRLGPERDRAIAAAINAYAEGLTLTEAAEQYGVSKQAMRMWLLSEAPEEYRQAQTEGLLTRIAEADDGIAEAKDTRDPIVLACAREQARFARMDLERRRPHLYGPKQEVTHTVKPVLIINTSPLPVSLPQQIEDAALLPPISPTPEPSDAA